MFNISCTTFKEEDTSEYRTKYKLRITGKDATKFNELVEPRNPKRQLLVRRRGFEPRLRPWQGRVLATGPTPRKIFV
jgi:hypothetical protein